MPRTMTYTEELTVTSCWCGINLAIPSDLYDYAQRRKQSIYCPLGHTFVYSDTVEDQLRREREKSARLTARNDQLHATNTTLRGHITRKKKQLARVQAGVCPDCNRSFQNLARHMESKHPKSVA